MRQVYRFVVRRFSALAERDEALKRFSTNSVVLCLALFLMAAGIQARAEEAPAAKNSRGPSYANTPEALTPYRNFQNPARRFYDQPMAYRGGGEMTQAPAGPALKSVKIGILVPLTSGPDAAVGRSLLEGAKLAIQQANEAGGYLGIPFSLAVRDDTGAWTGATHQFVRLATEDKVLAVLGSVDAASTHVALRISLKLHLPIVNTVSGDPTLTETGLPWIVRTCQDDRQVSYALARYIFEKQGLRAVALLRDNNRYGRVGVMEFVDAARRIGFPVRTEVRYDSKRYKETYREQLERIRAAGADAVVLWGNAKEAAQIVREMRNLRMDLPVFGCERLSQQDFIRLAQGAARGVVVAATFNPKAPHPRFHQFRTDFKKLFNKEPDTFAAHAYDGMNFLLAAVQKAGPDRVRIRHALFSVHDFPGVTGRMKLDATGNNIAPIWLARVEKNAFQYFQMK